MIRALVSCVAIGAALGIAGCSSSSPTPTPGGGTAGATPVHAGGASGGAASGGANAAVNGGAAGASQGGTSTAVAGQAPNGGSSSAGTSGGDFAGGAGPIASAGAGTSAGAGGADSVVTPPQVVTSANNDFWKVGTYTKVASGTADVTVSASGTQTWTGFGGTFNEAGWDALSVLSSADQMLAITLLYGAANGANFAGGRIPIGASDYAMSEYTLDDVSTADYDMTHFSISRDQQKLIPYIRAALAVKPNIRFWASPWTPPPWLKDNTSYDAVANEVEPYASKDGVMVDDKDGKNLTAYALYLEKFVQEYGKLGITISAVHPQNEPGYGNPYPSCYWPAAMYIKFIRDYLGPKFKMDLPNTEIWGGTMSAPGDGTIATSLAADATAMTFVKGFGLQWNTIQQVATLKSKGLVMQTEHKCGNYSFYTDNKTGGAGDFSWNASQYDPDKPQNDYAYGVESWKYIRDWVKAGVNGYSAWNMVLDTTGANLNQTKTWHQNALLVVDRSAKKLIQTPAYFVFRHVSQYVTLPATVVATSGGDALAFKSADGSFTVVLYNKDAQKTMTVSVGGALLQVSAPANGWATVYYKP